MPITYDISKDKLYQRGKVEGKMEERREVIKNHLVDGSLSVEKIAILTNSSVELVQQIQQEQGLPG